MRIRYYLGLAMLLLAGSVSAQSTFVLNPSSATAGEEVFVVANSPGGCYHGENPRVTVVGDAVELRLSINDTGCPPSPISFSIGSFDAGNYQVTVIECPAPPIPCTTGAVLSLSVAGGAADSPVVVPALSGRGLAILLLGVVLIAMALRRDS